MNNDIEQCNVLSCPFYDKRQPIGCNHINCVGLTYCNRWTNYNTDKPEIRIFYKKETTND